MQWLREEDIVKTISGETLVENSVGDYLITSSGMSLEDAGQYYCRIQYTNNTSSGLISAGTLTVLESSAIVAPSPQYALLNNPITLHATIEGVDGISDGWGPAGNTETFTSDGNEFAMVTMDNEGVYVCRFADPQGRMPTFKVEVQLIVTVLPNITMVPLEKHMFTGDSFSDVISLQFRARNDTFSNVVWRQEGEILPATGTGYSIETVHSTVLEGRTSLIFSNSFLSRSFRGEYCVVITNSNGVIPEPQQSVKFTFHIMVIVVPAEITSVNVSSLTPQLARVDWAVEYRHRDEQPDYIIISVVAVETDTVSEYRVANSTLRMFDGVAVVPGTAYSVSLHSVNEDGEDTTLPVPFQTQDTVASIESSTVARINKTAYSVTSSLQYTGGGVITHFNVSFRVMGKSEWNGAIIVPAQVVPESDNLVWTGVIRSSEFAVYSALEFRVLVVNERELITADDGSYVTEPQVLPAQPASIDAVSTTTTSAVLDVQLSVVGTPPLVVVMVLTSHPELGCCDNMTSYQRGDSVRFSLQGLSPDTTYSVNVFAVNLAGQGNGRQVSFSTDRDGPTLPLWQTVLIGVCGFVVLAVVLVLFCVLLCCGCKASKNWGRKEYHTGPIEMETKELDHSNALVSRSIHSNGYAGSQISYGSNSAQPAMSCMTPRSPTGLSATSPSFNFNGKANFNNIHSRRLSSSMMSPFHDSSREQLTRKTSVSHGDLYFPQQHYPDPYPDEPYQSLPRSGFTTEAVDSVFSFHSTLPLSTMSPPPAPKSFATDV